MNVVAAILALVAIVLFVLLVISRRQLRNERTRAGVAQQTFRSDLAASMEEQVRLEKDAAEARQRADTAIAAANFERAEAARTVTVAEERAAEAEARATAQAAQIDSLERYGVELKGELATASHDAEMARTGARTASEELATAQATVERLRAEAAGAGSGTTSGSVDPELLWALELTRSERTWRHSVAVDPSGPSPFADTPDPLKFAVEVEAAAMREEVGAFIQLRWDAEPVADPVRRLLILRVANELLATAARAPQPFEMFASGADEVTITVRSSEEGDPPIQIDPPRFGTDVIAFSADDSGVTVTIR